METPQVSSADVSRIVRRDFAAEDVELAEMALNEYDAGREPHRVRMAVLKLAGGNLSRVESYVKAARSDCRDVLSSAEHHAYCELPFTASDDAKAEAARQDWDEYQAWLNRR